MEDLASMCERLCLTAFCCPGLAVSHSSPQCRFLLSGGGLCGWTATVVAGRAVALCRCVAGWCGSFRGVLWLDLVRPSVGVPCLVLWCLLVRSAASCCVLTCCEAGSDPNWVQFSIFERFSRFQRFRI